MNFDSIGQYFYKLYIAVLLILLIAIFTFIAIYLATPGGELRAPASGEIRLRYCGIVVVAWFVMFFFITKKIKTIRNLQGLRLKLENYFQLTIVRYSLIVALCLVLAYGFYSTKDDVLTAMFAFNLVMSGLLWPTSSRVCRELKLRGDEREMVYYKKDYL